MVRSLREFDATVTIIMLTGYDSIATALEAMRCDGDARSDSSQTG
ncbi:MAG: hypothetical protein ACLQBK_26725 [Candidatus Sulfotelmatobacter sp.]